MVAGHDNDVFTSLLIRDLVGGWVTGNDGIGFEVDFFDGDIDCFYFVMEFECILVLICIA